MQYEEGRDRDFKFSRVLNLTYSQQHVEIAETGEWKVNFIAGRCEEGGDALSASDHALDHVKHLELSICASCNIENEGTGVSSSRGFIVVAAAFGNSRDRS